MPILTARSDAGLSPDLTAASADSYVPAGHRLAVQWIEPLDGANGALARVRLAGRYTGPPGCVPLPEGSERFLNPRRFEVPSDAWRPAPSLPAPESPSPNGAGVAPPERPLPPEVAALNHHYESCRLEAYADPISGGEPVTIGWGSTFHPDGTPITWGERITQDQADALYEHNCYHRFWKKLQASIPHWQQMSDRQRAALCSFAYNNGADFYGSPNHETITRLLREREWRAVPAALMLYRKAPNPSGELVEVLGLGRRRRAEGLVWTGMPPEAAFRQAEQELQSVEDCRRIQQELQNHPPGLTDGPGGGSPESPLESQPESPPRSLRLQSFLGTDLRLTYESIAADAGLATQIQIRLIDLGLLDPPTGPFGPISTAALQRFQELMECGEPNHLGAVTAKRLIETSIDELPRPTVDLSANDLAARIIAYMQKKNYTVFTGTREMNIVYVEGMNPDGTLNDDTPNHFNDIRVVIDFQAGRPRLLGCWEATTEPGRSYTLTPLSPRGAARIKFGQYRAWRVGLHGSADPHRALVQVESITVHRDANKDFIRTGDNEETGNFGINQHHGYDLPRNDIRNASAGCLVGRSRKGHAEFMGLIEQDPRYLCTPLAPPLHSDDPRERGFLFTTTVIAGDDLARQVPAG